MRVALQAATSEDLLAQTVPRVYPVTKVHTGHLDVLVNQVNALLMMTYLSFVVFFLHDEETVRKDEVFGNSVHMPLYEAASKPHFEIHGFF